MFVNTFYLDKDKRLENWSVILYFNFIPFQLLDHVFTNDKLFIFSFDEIPRLPIPINKMNCSIARTSLARLLRYKSPPLLLWKNNSTCFIPAFPRFYSRIPATPKHVKGLHLLSIRFRTKLSIFNILILLSSIQYWY